VMGELASKLQNVNFNKFGQIRFINLKTQSEQEAYERTFSSKAAEEL